MRKLSFLFMIIFVFALVACQQGAKTDSGNGIVENESKVDVVDKNRSELNKGIGDPAKENKEEVKKEIALSTFFMKDEAEAEFRGEGNEFAQFTAKTQWLNDHFVNVYENNGGTVMLRTFRIDKDKIVVVREEGESYDDYSPSDSELKQLEPIYTYLHLPLNKGSKFDGWTVIDNKATLDTPLQEFSDVIVIEREGDDGSITRKYFAKDYGEIKREIIMKEGTEEFTVTSTIEKVK
ncbi:hypothetical protein [Bacillus sp. FSL K6-3431]|uniref:hypothetical protein n=1 Tax=Bacillus sp. FSL K6-3431 TaxID=2921500 RepID=UPI0030F7E46C